MEKLKSGSSVYYCVCYTLRYSPTIMFAMQITFLFPILFANLITISIRIIVLNIGSGMGQQGSHQSHCVLSFEPSCLHREVTKRSQTQERIGNDVGSVADYPWPSLRQTLPILAAALLTDLMEDHFKQANYKSKIPRILCYQLSNPNHADETLRTQTHNSETIKRSNMVRETRNGSSMKGISRNNATY